jgi:ribosome maturation factor RimP
MMARSDDRQLPGRVRDLARPVADPLGVEILEVAVKGQPGRRVVRVTADAQELDADANLDIDTIARLSRELGDALDEQDLIPGAYTLEVTSPGADRPLTTPRDFARNVGRDVRVTRSTDDDGPSELTGTLVGVTDDDITIEVDGREVVVRYTDLDHGKVVLPW